MDKIQIEELRKLKTLLDEEIITKEEFVEKRDRLLVSSSDVEEMETDIAEESLAVIKESEIASDDVQTNTDTSEDGLLEKSTDDRNTSEMTGGSKTSTIIIVFVAVAVALTVFGIISINNKAKKTCEALYGEWTYAESYADRKYDAELNSSIIFSEDNTIEIHMDESVCKGKWSVDAGFDHVSISIFDETVDGQSDNMDNLLSGWMEYKEYDDGINLYWSDSTSTHYYKHK